MSCPARDDINRLNKTWKWSAIRCPGNDPTLRDCPSGFQDSVGTKEDTYEYGGCWAAGSNNKAKCFKEERSFTEDEIAKCCSGESDQYSCPVDFCSTTPQNCANNFLPSYCNKADNITKRVCSQTLKLNNKIKYNEILNDYCEGEKLNSQVCKDYCKENLGSCSDKLKKFCKHKVGNATYNDICACFYDPQLYLDISTKLAKDWNFPEELGDPKPQCIYNKCKQSDIVPDTTLCGAISIASCIQNIDIDATGATIGNVNVKETADCKSTFKRKNNNTDNNSSSGSNDNTDNNSSSGSNDNTDSNNNPSPSPSVKPGMSGLTLGLIVVSVIFIILVLIIIGVIIYNN